MKNIITNNYTLYDMPVTEIISIASSTFFTIMLVLSVYLMSSNSLHYGFGALIAASLYFMTSNVNKLKLFTAFAWLAVMIFALKGFLGV